MSAARRLGFSIHALVVAVLCLAQLGVFAHLTLVSHRVCAEHGELIHDGEDHAPRAVLERSSAGATIHRRAVADAHGHDHCLLAAHRRERAVLPPASVVASADFPCAEAVLDAAPSARALRSAVLLRFAPKTSPPA
jgi:hypothetical protein